MESELMHLAMRSATSCGQCAGTLEKAKVVAQGERQSKLLLLGAALELDGGCFSCLYCQT